MLPEQFTEYARIRCDHQQNPLFEEENILSFFWEGSQKAPVKIKWGDREIIEHPNFPFKLIKIDNDPLNGYDTYARTDTTLNLKIIQFLEWRWLQHCKAFNYFQMQIIMTLHIWGAAYVETAEEPSWACVGKKNPFRK